MNEKEIREAIKEAKHNLENEILIELAEQYLKVSAVMPKKWTDEDIRNTDRTTLMFMMSRNNLIDGCTMAVVKRCSKEEIAKIVESHIKRCMNIGKTLEESGLSFIPSDVRRESVDLSEAIHKHILGEGK